MKNPILFLLLAISMLMSSCYSAVNEDDLEFINVTILVDESSPQDLKITDMGILKKADVNIKNLKEKHLTVTLGYIDNTSTMSSKQLVLDPTTGVQNRTARKKKFTSFRTELRKELQTMKKRASEGETNSTSIYKPLKNLIENLDQGATNYLIVASDMVENSNVANFYKTDNWRIDVEEDCKGLDLMGTSVIMVYDTEEAPSDKLFQRGSKKFGELFKKLGADNIEITGNLE